MANLPYDLQNRKFVLKRVGDELYLPCVTAIGCKAPPYVPGSAYVLCETEDLDAETGTLKLNAPTDYTPQNANSYANSVKINSQAILDAGVKAFLILYGGQHWLEPPRYEAKPTGEGQGAGSQVPSPPQSFIISKQLPVAFASLTFDEGVIRFTQFVDTRLGEVSFDVIYSTSRKVYDAVKDYFQKVFRKKTLVCQITVEMAGREILSKTAQFVPDNPFDFSVIERVSDCLVEDTILNSDEPISLVDDKLKAVVDLTENHLTFDGLLDTLHRLKKSKHYHHLRHLSSLHEADMFRLQMTGKPVSFIFVAKGPLHYHLVWETYETEEATYVWQLLSGDSQSRRQEMTEIIDKIKWLREKNKMQYRKSAPGNFHYIEHDYAAEDGGLLNWKTALDLYLT